MSSEVRMSLGCRRSDSILDDQRIVGRLRDGDPLATRGNAIYLRKYQAVYGPFERKFLVIDVISESAYLGNSAAAAYKTALDESPDGLFYLKRIPHVKTCRSLGAHRT